VTINQSIGVVKYPGVAKGLYVASQSGYFQSLFCFRWMSYKGNHAYAY